jgi:hypothetical protein
MHIMLKQPIVVPITTDFAAEFTYPTHPRLHLFNKASLQIVHCKTKKDDQLTKCANSRTVHFLIA